MLSIAHNQRVCRDHPSLPVLGLLLGLEGDNSSLLEAFLALQYCEWSEFCILATL